MRQLTAFALALVCVLTLVGCNKQESIGNNTIQNSDTYIVMDVTESHLLVAEIDEDGGAAERKQYSIPNEFQSSSIVIGDTVKIEHNGVILETFPMQFEKIYAMEYQDKETGLGVAVIID